MRDMGLSDMSPAPLQKYRSIVRIPFNIARGNQAVLGAWGNLRPTHSSCALVVVHDARVLLPSECMYYGGYNFRDTGVTVIMIPGVLLSGIRVAQVSWV